MNGDRTGTPWRTGMNYGKNLSTWPGTNLAPKNRRCDLMLCAGIHNIWGLRFKCIRPIAVTNINCIGPFASIQMICIIDYGLGNLGSMLNMLRKIGAMAIISSDHETIKKADKLILPGVGSFDAGMGRLKSQGLIPVLEKMVLEEKKPLLGVCLGMQLLGKRSDEGTMPGLGWFDAETIRFKFKGVTANLKVPHMGWNQVSVHKNHPLFDQLEARSRFYFVHSYHVVCEKSDDMFATTFYGFDFTAVMVKDNIVGVQFHPEKSHKYGMRLLKNFSEQVKC